MTKLSESSEFTIPLKNLLAMIAATAVSVWAYFGISERLSFLEHNLEMLAIEVEENDDWIDDFEPPPEVRKFMPVIAPGIHLDAVEAFKSILRIKGMGDIMIPVHDPSYATIKSIP